MAITKSSACYVNTEENLQGILYGVTITIDPSVGSSSSMPGYCVRKAGVEVSSGILEIPAGESLRERLVRLGNHMRKLYRDFPADVLILEEIPAQRHGGSAVSHASLLQAVGAIKSIPGPSGYVGIYPTSWKRLVGPDYKKGDEADAREISRIITDLAHSIYAERVQKGEGRANGQQTKGKKKE